MALAACGSDSETATAEDDSTIEQSGETSSDSATDSGETGDGETSTFQIDVWADNWMAVYVDGELVGEDSVPITTERSFNSETFTFDASYPFTLAIEAKDFKETDSGLEYIGEDNQQMGDGGIIAQVTEASTGEVVAGTDSSWASFVVHRAPLDTSCESDDNPDETCEFETVETPSDWATTAFDDSAWPTATEWSAADVDPKMGYDDIGWDDSAQLIWGTDLEVDNTVLLRTVVGG